MRNANAVLTVMGSENGRCCPASSGIIVARTTGRVATAAGLDDDERET